MWKIVQELLPALLIVIFITQWVLPILLNKRTWWLFRGEAKEIQKLVDSSKLIDEIKSTKVVVDEVKAKIDEVKTKVEENLKSAEDLKKEAEKLN
jgi:hypothetical protein